MMTDESGHWPTWNQVFAVVAVVVVVAAIVAISIATVGVGTTLIAAGIGAAAGVAGKYIEDVTYNTAKGKTGVDRWRPSSSWQDYASSAMAGGVSGMVDAVAPGSSKVAKNAMDAIVKPYVKQNLEIASGARTNINIAKMAEDTAWRFGTSSLLKTKITSLPTPGLNKVAGSFFCSTGRGLIKYGKKEAALIPVFGN